MPNKKNKSKQRRSVRRRKNVKSRKVMRGGGVRWWSRLNNPKNPLSVPLLPVRSQQMNGNIELIKLPLQPLQMVNNEIPKTTFPIKYTVEQGDLYDGTSKIHISKIDNKEQNPPIALVVNENNKVSTLHSNFISINNVDYVPVKIIPTA